MFLKKTPKPKGTYLAITESYYDKEKKTTRQKTIMPLGYLEELKKEYPDPVAHFEQVVADMNQERETRKNSVVYIDLTTPLLPSELSQKNIGYGILKFLYKELQLDIFWRTKAWKLSLPYNIEEVFRFIVISQILYPYTPWTTTIKKGIYFETVPAFSQEHIDSALNIIVKYQKDIQKWIFEHSHALLDRDLSVAFLDQTDYTFSIPGIRTSETQPNSKRTDSTLRLKLLTDHQGIPVAYDLFTGDIQLNQSVSTAVKKIKKDSFDCRYIFTSAKRTKSQPFICDGLVPDGFIYEQSVYNADLEFKEWILTDGYQKLNAWSDSADTSPLLYKERIFENREKQFVCYHELQARQQRLARETIGRRTGLKLDGYYAIVTSELQADSSSLFLCYNGLRRMESNFRAMKSNYDSLPSFIWTPEKINAHFIICFTAFVIMRMLQAKLDFRFSMAQIIDSLQRYNCVQISGNIYQFTYYDELLNACERVLGLNLHNKYLNQLQIRRLLRY